MFKCKKKPIVIQAEKWTGGDETSFDELHIITILKDDGMHFGIQTLEGMHELSEGCYILCGVDGEFYPCKKEIFEKTYDIVGEENKRSSIAVDFDGVIHKYSKGWHDGTCYDEPMSGAENGLRLLMEQFNVFILSTRDPGQIKEWMDKNTKIPTEVIPPGTLFWNKSGVIGITNQKLAAVAYIDDRAIAFDSWDRLTEKTAVDFK